MPYSQLVNLCTVKHKTQQNYLKRKVTKLANGFRKPDTDFTC